METIQIKVRLFGAFRNFEEKSELELTVPNGASLAQIKPELARLLAGGEQIRALLAESAFADEQQMLSDSEILTSNAKLAILPPVCGG